MIAKFYIKTCGNHLPMASLKEAKAHDFEKIASSPRSFKNHTFPASFIKVLPLPQKINRFHCFCFHVPNYCILTLLYRYVSNIRAVTRVYLIAPNK